MAKYITEVLKEINDDPSLFQTTYKKQGDGGPLSRIFAHAFLPDWKFILPEGEPPYKLSAEPLGMTPSHMLAEVRRFYIMCDRNISPLKREQIFVQMLESMHPSEAKVLLAIKEQTLNKMYPNITHKLVADAGFIPQPPQIVAPVTGNLPEIAKVETLPVETKKKRGRPPGSGKKQKPAGS